MLDLIAGICTLMLGALILSPITQRIRRKEHFSFPFVSIFIVLLIGTPVCIYFGWKAVYYTLAGFAGLSFFFSILLRFRRKND
ncbi:MAG: hypothetical protein MUP22_07560, partial [Desulfobacterales bacterium]|nr:hypothetical protein [Desulfobacterales bacterium]